MIIDLKRSIDLRWFFHTVLLFNCSIQKKLCWFNSKDNSKKSLILVESEKCPKSVLKKKKKMFCLTKNENIDSVTASFSYFTIKFNSKDYSIFSGIFNSKDFSIINNIFFHNSKNDSKIWIWLYSIQQNIHSIIKQGYRRPLLIAGWFIKAERVASLSQS